MAKLKLYNQNKDLGLLIIRISLALLFIYSGLAKFIGEPIGGSGLEQLSTLVWDSIIIAFLVAFIELLAGIGILVGYMNNISSVALAIIMIGAILTVHLSSGNVTNILVHVVLLGSLLGLSLTGPGKYAIEKN